MTNPPKYALSSADHLLSSADFYKYAVIDNNMLTTISNVSSWAAGRTQDSLAERVCGLVADDPPEIGDFKSALRYFSSKILRNVPKTHYYDDVFWCCLLSKMDSLGHADLSIGGPIHRALTSLYDDFHPGDVTLD